LQRLLHRLPAGNTGRVEFDRPRQRRDNRSLAVQRHAQRIDHPANHGIADGHAQQLAGGPHLVSLGDLQEITQNDDADGVLFEVERHALDADAGEIHHFAGHDAAQTVDAGNAVAHFQHLADFDGRELAAVLVNFLRQNGSDLVRFESHDYFFR